MKLGSILFAVKRYILRHDTIRSLSKRYYRRYRKYSFKGSKCNDEIQYEAVITRWYHTIEKGLAYRDYRAGFGARNINALLAAMENYVREGYDTNAFFFRCACSTLNAYQEKNREHGWINDGLQQRIDQFKGNDNGCGGVIEFSPVSEDEIKKVNYETFILSRHSMRDFSPEDVDINKIKKAICLGQHTPSACNRQGWRTLVIENKDIIRTVLINQNGNQGFGHKFNKLLLIVADTRYFNRDRELFQPYIDGGMYAQSILNALHYMHIASCPLSAALKGDQEYNIRQVLPINKSEVPIIFIGIGNYPDCNICQTTRSERRTPDIVVV